MRNPRLFILQLLSLVLMLGVASFCFSASVPQIINYQGALKLNGTPANGPVNMTFSAYSTATGGSPLWTENWSSTATPSNPVIVTNGNFNVMLGALNPFPATFFADHPKTYLGIKVGTDSEMLPRQQFASVGYSLAAGNGIPKGGIIMWSGAVNQVPDGWALCDGTNGTPNLRDKFVLGAGGTLPVTGGTAAINLAHSHTVNDHSHTFSGTTSGPTSTKSVTKTSSDTAVPDSVHTHTYSGTTLGASNRGTDSQLSPNQSILPPYYALAFIMKL